ncbi:hypothetical protein DOTSEDRAFT_45021 [Dothistroma septosporum NZE10]|uniref:Thioesterase domain-containing protein n=1 Tax=Dothistroma septosporum (strain NZE10 / CBS 128990) TaxID=675120 RepID=M2YLT4_DOTSN|nr:hypothetical protein DOTSEDRAFT_45021 [Dothistroma septosporum NZE10]
MATTFAQVAIAKDGFWEFGGVSRTLSVTYLKPIVQDTVVVIECSVRSVGKRSTVLQCVMKDKATGKLLALAEHGKAALASQAGQKPRISQL